MNENILEFDDLPAPQACWWAPLQIEPIIGSGEKITIAIMYTFGSSKICISKILDKKISALPIKENYETLEDIVDLSSESIFSTITALSDLERWTPPIQGIFVGRIREAMATSIDELLYQACYRSSFLSIGTSFKSDLDKSSNSGDSERFHRFIERYFSQKKPEFSDYFNRKTRVGNSRFQTKFGFLNENICADFGVINPTGVPYGLIQLKAKMINLEAAKIFCEDEKPRKVQMIVLRPEEQFTTVSKKNSEKISDTLSMLSDLANKNSIGLIGVYSQYQGAEYLFKEAA